MKPVTAPTLQQTLDIMDRTDALRRQLQASLNTEEAIEHVLTHYRDQGVSVPRELVEQAVRDYQAQAQPAPRPAPAPEDWSWFRRRLLWVGLGGVAFVLSLPVLRLLFRLLARLL